MGAPVRVLVPGDEPRLEAFLARHAASSMFLRSNLLRGGLVYGGEAFQADWVAAFAGDEPVAVASHSWNGMLLVQAPEALPDVARAALAASGRPLSGLAGPWEQVREARRVLGMAGRPVTLESRDELFQLRLAALRTPAWLSQPQFEVRLARPDEAELLAAWRVAYRVELLGQRDGDALRADSRREIDLALAASAGFVLCENGSPVSYSGFNAQLPDCVQVGGVFTPPALRGRGYARGAVAGSLELAGSGGVREALLFTGEENASAQQVYRALGFRVVGDYGLILFEDEPA